MKNLLALGRYSGLKALTLGLSVIVGLYLTILVVNMGGRLDDVRRAEIEYSVAAAAFLNPANEGIPPSVLRQMIQQQVELAFRVQELDRPFILRSFGYLTDALSLSLGRAQHITSPSGSREVRNIIMEFLPATLILFGTANLLIFFLSLWAGLALSRRYGSWTDRVMVALAPTGTAPGWFYGIFLILIFAAVLKVLPWGGMVEAPSPQEPLAYAVSVLRHMILPVLAMAVGGFFSSVYARRTFFLIFSSEDYVDLAKAKGLSSRVVQNRYILRPTLPTIIAQFMLMIIAMWQGAIILESVFKWPGLGTTFLSAINQNDTAPIVGFMVIYGYLLALSVFLLDFIYAIVDPRVRVGATARRGL